MTRPPAQKSGRTPDTIGPLGPDVISFTLALKAAGRKQKTRRTYAEAVCWFGQHLDLTAITSWTQVSRKHVREWLAWLDEQGYSAAYRSNQFRSLQQFFAWFSAEEEAPNVMSGLTPPSVPMKLVPVIPDKELTALLATCTGRSLTALRDKAIILLFSSSGARLAEIAGLRVSDLDLEGAAAIVTGKGDRQRIVRYSPDAALALAKYMRVRALEGGKGHDELWIGQRGPIHPNAIALMLRRRGEKAGVHANAHRFRHSFSHAWMVRGGNETDLMTLAGWNSASMVARYGRSAAAERARANYDRIMAG